MPLLYANLLYVPLVNHEKQVLSRPDTDRLTREQQYIALSVLLSANVLQHYQEIVLKPSSITRV